MRIHKLAVLAFLTGSALCGTSRADWLSEMAHHCKVVYHRNVCWPRPFVYPDREAARAPFYKMVSNGWAQESTLGEHHFRAGGDTLTVEGRRKLYWILTSTPPDQRQVNFVGGADAELAQRQRDAIENELVRIAPQEGQQILISQTKTVPYNWSGYEVENSLRRYQESAPEPRLPAAGSGDGGEGSY